MRLEDRIICLGDLKNSPLGATPSFDKIDGLRGV